MSGIARTWTPGDVHKKHAERRGHSEGEHIPAGMLRGAHGIVENGYGQLTAHKEHAVAFNIGGRVRERQRKKCRWGDYGISIIAFLLKSASLILLIADGTSVYHLGGDVNKVCDSDLAELLSIPDLWRIDVPVPPGDTGNSNGQ